MSTPRSYLLSFFRSLMMRAEGLGDGKGIGGSGKGVGREGMKMERWSGNEGKGLGKRKEGNIPR
jgi:hypothetical protein